MNLAIQATYEIADQSWLDQRLAFEDDETNAIQFQVKPKIWHPILAPIRDQLFDAADAWAARKLAHDAVEIRQSKDPRYVHGPDWIPRVFSRTGYDIGMLIPRSQPGAFRVTTVTYRRALAIANAILLAAESRACTVGYSEIGSLMRIRLEDAELFFALRERQNYHFAKGRYAKDKLYEITDRIAVCVERSHEPRFELIDKKDAPVENRLNELFRRLYKSVVVARAATRVQKAKDELKKIEDAAYEEFTRQHAIEAKSKAGEQERRKVLIYEAGTWQQAQNIRAYAAHILSMPDDQHNQNLKAWVDWAAGVADQMDPSASRLAAVLSNN